MKKINVVIVLSMLVVILIASLAQAPLQRSTQQKVLEQLSIRYQQQFEQKKVEADAWATANKSPLRKEFPDGSIIEIQEIYNGRPLYYKTDNLNAAKTISTDDVWQGEAAGLNLSGSGITLGEWDGGGVRLTHQEFGGRVTQRDSPAGTSSHSTHVAGTMVASGVVANAKGMAHQGNLDAYDWNSDESEMASAGAAGLLMSNHSYSYITGWYYNYFGDSRWAWFGDPAISETEDYGFGFYSDQSREWDLIAFNAPDYLIVKSAGNDRNDSGPSPGASHWVYDGGWVLSSTAREVDGGPDGYDCIPGGAGVSKNLMTLGAVNDIPGGYSQPSDVVMTSFSSWGPADDGRIKPDIVANGASLYSCDDDHNSDYTTKSGTSMSSPNATGSLALLQEHYKTTHNQEHMRSATLKGLVIHTADEAGSFTGPDYAYGWGLMNTWSAADLISLDEVEQNTIQELLLTQGGSYSLNFSSDGTEPAKVTICWTDPPGLASSPQLNPRTPTLINDLDLRVTRISDGTDFLPWVLDVNNPSAAATTADNIVDNVEQVYIESPVAGDYQVTVNHKGSLSGGEQNFSLIIGGGDQASTECLPPYIATFEAYGVTGDSVVIDIFIEDNPTPIDAFGFRFNFCSDKLLLGTIEKGDLSSHFSFFQGSETTPGSVLVGGFDPTVIPAHSSGTIARISLLVDQCEEGDSCALVISDLTDDLVDLNICEGIWRCIPQCWLGDPNMDEVITPGDALCCFQYYMSGGSVPPECDTPCLVYSCDSNCDGVTTPGDALIVFMAYLSGTEPPLECPGLFGLKKTGSAEGVSVSIQETDDSPENQISFYVNVENAEGINCFGLDLGFPDDKLELIDVTVADLTAQWQVFEGKENLAGVIRIGGFNPEAGGSTENGNLAKVTFRIREEAAGSGDLWIYNTIDDLNEAISETFQINFDQPDSPKSTDREKAASYELEQNYPNPFNMNTEISYQTAESGSVQLIIYNLTGQKIRTLVSETQQAGHHIVRWDGKDDFGNEVSSGVYMYKLSTRDSHKIRKLVILK